MQSLRQLFSYLNDVSFPYVVLRNWDNLPDSVELGQHSDLDLLVYDLDHFLEIITEAKREFPAPRVRFQVPIADEFIYIDVRSIDDGYYPKHFAQNIINTREWNENGFYTPDPVHHRVALAYHAVHHKNGVSHDYRRWLGDVTVDQLLETLRESTVGWTKPKDPTVGSFHPYWKGATSVVEKTPEGHILKKQVSYTDYNLIDNEYRILSKAESRRFPKVFGMKDEGILIEDCGVPLNEKNIPSNWKDQLLDVYSELKKYNIQHRDIKPDNFMVKDEFIRLIDFGWARFYDDPQDSPPDCLGYPYKPSYGYDDGFSLKKVMKVIENKLEEHLCV